jgi:integrase
MQKAFKSDNHGYIYIRVGIPGTKKYVRKSLGHKIPADHWDEDNQMVTRKNEDAFRINNLLAAYLKNLKKILDEEYEKGAFFTKEYIEALLDPDRSSANFIAFFENYLRKISPQQSNNTASYLRSFTTSFNTFKAFVGKSIAFSQLTTSLLEKYQASMVNMRVKVPGTKIAKPLSPNTKHLRMRHLKEVMDSAVAQGLLQAPQYYNFNWPSYIPVEKDYLVMEQTEGIWNSIVNGEYDYNTTLKEVACYFLVECYSGLRFSDWPRFTTETIIDNEALKVRARKNGQPVYLYFDQFKKLAAVVRYIQQHNIIFTQSSPSTNRMLKIIAAHQRISVKLTTHTGRHTFGTFLAVLGYTDKEIADHMGISEDVAKIYAKNTGQTSRSAQLRHGGI